MIIRESSVSSHLAGCGIGGGGVFYFRRGFALIAVAECENDHTARTGKHPLRIHSFERVPLNPGHLAVASFGKPPFQLSGMLGRVSRGEAAGVKAESGGTLSDKFFHAFNISGQPRLDRTRRANGCGAACRKPNWTDRSVERTVLISPPPKPVHDLAGFSDSLGSEIRITPAWPGSGETISSFP